MQTTNSIRIATPETKKPLISTFATGYLKLVLLRTGDFLRLWPPGVRYGLAKYCFIMLFLILGYKRRAVRGNLSFIFNRMPSAREVLRVFTEYSRYWAELIDIISLWRKVDRRYHGPLYPIPVGRFLGLTFHLGNFELFGLEYFHHFHQPFKVVAERLQPPFLARYFFNKRLRGHLHTIPHDDVSTIVRTLLSGSPLGIVCDRMVGKGTGFKSILFGQTVRMPLNTLQIAFRENIPVFTAYAICSDHRIDFFSHHVKATEVDIAVREIASVLEDAVRRFPYQWHLLTPFYERE